MDIFRDIVIKNNFGPKLKVSNKISKYETDKNNTNQIWFLISQKYNVKKLF